MFFEFKSVQSSGVIVPVFLPPIIATVELVKTTRFTPFFLAALSTLRVPSTAGPSMSESFLGFSIEAPKVILSLDELEQIKNTKFVNENHEIARDWLIIGCFTGQRVSDLLRMNTSFIQHIQDFDLLEKVDFVLLICFHDSIRNILLRNH